MHPVHQGGPGPCLCGHAPGPTRPTRTPGEVRSIPLAATKLSRGMAVPGSSVWLGWVGLGFLFLSARLRRRNPRATTTALIMLLGSCVLRVGRHTVGKRNQASSNTVGLTHHVAPPVLGTHVHVAVTPVADTPWEREPSQQTHRGITHHVAPPVLGPPVHVAVPFIAVTHRRKGSPTSSNTVGYLTTLRRPCLALPSTLPYYGRSCPGAWCHPCCCTAAVP